MSKSDLRPKTPLDNIKIVMVNTSHSGNIGSAARAMRVMGLYNLTLVSPRKFPSQEAVALASGALDILENAEVVETLPEAIKGCHFVLGTSARARYIGKPEIDVEMGAKKIKEQLTHHPDCKIAILFGSERTGLLNEEVDLCQELIYIPTENNYNSLNIASAIQIISYELRKNMMEKGTPRPAKEQEKIRQLPATSEELEGYFNHLERTLIKLSFLNEAHPTPLMRKLRLLYKKADLTKEEINILRGILTETERNL